MDINFEVDDDFIDQLEDKIGKQTPRKLMKDALTLLNWAATEIQKGHVICSSNVDGEEVKELNMPVLNKIKKVTG